MKRFFSVLMVALMVFSCVALPVSAMAASKTVVVTFKTVDPSTGKIVKNVVFDIWKVTKIDHGEQSECVKDSVKSGKNGIVKVKLPCVSGNTHYEINVSDAPKGYASYCDTTTKFKLTGAKTVKVKVLPEFQCKMKVIDSDGKAVSGAKVQICGLNGTTGKSGVAAINGVSYGKHQVQVLIHKKDADYIAYEKTLNLTGTPGGTFTKTLTLKPESQWTKLEMIVVAKKPIIYLYSDIELDVNVRLGYPENLISVYPAYDEHTGWHVQTVQNGMLKDLSTGRSLYSLYWEGLNPDCEIQDTGFIVSGEDTAAFLEDKLAILGLTEREIEEFIIYWLPQMQCNDLNYIRFAESEEIDQIMPLMIDPKPDVVIRVLMEFTSLDGYEEIPEITDQELVPIDRNLLDPSFFVVVEWGASEF